MALDFKKAHAAVNSEWLNQVEEEKKTKAANTAKQKANYKSVKKTTGKSKNIAKTLPYNTAKDTSKTTTPTSNTGALSTNKSGRDTKHTKQGTIPYNTKSTYLQNKAAEEEKTKAANAVITQNTQICNNVNNIINNGSVIDRNQHKQVLNTVKPETENYSNGQFAKQVVKTGVQSYINEGLAKTADFILPDFITPEPVQKVLDYYEKTGETAREDLVKMSNGSKVKEVAGNLGAGAIGMLPNLIMGWASAAAKGAQLTGKIGETAVNALSKGGTKALSKFAAEAGTNSTTLGNTLATIAREKAQSPTFWTDFSQMLGTTYYNEKESGATDAEATASAFVNALMCAAVEDQGGIEKFNPNETVAQAFKRSFLEEASEEGLQGVIERIVNKAFGSDTNKWLSLNPEEEAVFNPYTTAEEMAYGGVLGGIMGGGRAAVNNTTSNVMNKFITDNMPTNKVPTNTQTVSGDPIQQAETQLSQLKTDAGIVRAETQAETKTDNASQWKEGDSYSYPGKNSPQDPAAYQYEVVSQGSDGKTRHTFFTDEKKAQANADNYNAMFGEGAAQVVNLQNEGELYNAVQQVTGNRAASQAESEAYLTQQTGKTADQPRAESENLFNQQQASINNNVQENYNENGGDIRQALQNTENKQQNIPYNYDLTTKEGRMAAKVTDEKTENQIAALSKVFKRNISFSTDFEEGVHGKHDLKTGDIVLNAASIKDGQSVTKIVLGHELTHGLEKTRAYKAMSNVIERYIDSQEGVTFREQVEKLRNSYQNEIKGMSDEEAYEYLKQEYIAEFAGNYIFNNEEFINRLCKEDRSTFERVKEWIQDTINKLTSKDEAYKMLTDARRLYDRAARQSHQTDTNNTVKAQTKKSKIPYNFTTKTWSTDAYSGQVDMRKTIYAGDKEVGYLEYSVYDDTPSVQYIHVDPEYRRSGAAKQLMQELQKEYPDTKINFGMTTEDGTKLLENISEERQNTDVINANKEIKQIRAQREELENRMDKYVDDYPAETRTQEQWDYIEEAGAEWDRLYKRERELENEYRGKSETSTFIKLSKGEGLNANTEAEEKLYNKLGFNQNTDNEGRELSEGQKKYFAHSKARDDKGNLLTLYHGTLSGGFTVFDKTKAQFGGNSGAGFYLSTNKADSEANYADVEGADNYFKAEHLAERMENAGEWNGIDLSEMDHDEILEMAKEELTKTPQTYEVYADIKNPYYRDAEVKPGSYGTTERSDDIMEKIMEDFEGPDIDEYEYEEDWEEDRYRLEDEYLYETVYNAVRKAVNIAEEKIPGYEIDSYGNYEDVVSSIFEKYSNEGRLDFRDLASVFADHEFAFYKEDTDESVFAETEMARAFLEALGYDGIIDRGVSKKFNQLKNMKAAGTLHVIAFSPEQIKNVDNYNPTENVDIRFSKNKGEKTNTAEEEKLFNNLAKASETSKQFTGKGKKKVEAARNLIAVHNMTGEELAKTLKLGGLPMPSIAIIKAEMGHDMYGPVSLVFHKDSIDPKANKANKVYGADAWTPTYPQVDYKVNSNNLGTVYDNIRDLVGDTGISVSSLAYPDEVERKLSSGRGDYAEAFNNEEALKYAYLKEKGETVDIPQTEEKLTTRYSNDQVREVYDAIVDKSLIDEMASSKWYREHPEAEEQIINILNHKKNRELNEKGRAEKGSEWTDKWFEFYKPDNFGFAGYDTIMRGVKKLNYNGGVVNQTKDMYALRQMLDDKVKYDDPDFRQWINDKFQGVIEKEGIYNGKDIFTNSGNRRSWESLHWEHNLENVVKAMKQKENGEAVFGSNFKAVAAREYKNIDEIRNDQERLTMMNEEDFMKQNEEYSNLFSEITDVFAQNGRKYSGIDDWTHRDSVREELVDAVRNGRTEAKMKQNLKNAAARWGTIRYDEEAASDLWQLVKDIQAMPTGYFEAKPERAMNIGEVATVIVPSDINPEILSQMNDYGLDVRTYKPGDEAERKQILNSLDELKFKKAAGLVADTEAEQKMYSDLERASQITSKKFQQQSIPYNRPAETATPETTAPEEATVNISNIQAPAQETRKAQEYTKRSGRNFRDNLLADLRITRWADSKAMKAYTDELQEKIKTGTLTEADKDRLFMDILAEGEVINQDKADIYGDLVTDLKNRTIYVPYEVSKNITDYKAFKRNSKLKLSNKTGVSIDDLYGSESDYGLQKKYGTEMFPNFNAEEEMLEHLDAVYKDATNVYTPLSQMSESQLDEAMTEYRAKFDKALDQLERDVNIAKRYNNFRLGKTVKEVSDDYANLNRLKIKADKVKQQIPLTDEDRTDLELLHKGAITEDQLRRRNDNADLVMIVYEAEKPVRAIQNKIKETGRETHAAYYDRAEKALENSDFWKSVKTGFNLYADTAERNFRTVAGIDSQAVIDEYLTPIHDNEANSTRMKNDYRDVVRSLNIGTKDEYDITDVPFDAPGLNEILQTELSKGKRLKVSESALIQLYGEGKITEEDLNTVGADVQKIQNCVNTMRGLYEQMYDAANEVLIKHGYEPIAHRENYFPHFTEDNPDGVLGAMAKALGFNVQLDELPTDIAGLTQGFRPGKKWWGNILQRTSDITEYDALKGFDRYLQGAGDVIFHTSDIQKLRAFENALRYKYSEKGVQEQLDAIRKDKTLNETQKQEEREKLYSRNIRQHGKFAEWIKEYTDTLAGKKSFLDRNIEKLANRTALNFFKSVEGRLAANMVAINPGSWLTNFIPLVQSSEIKNSNLVKGMALTVKSWKKNDGFNDRSTFITNRKGSDTLWSKTSDKVVGALASPMELIDAFTSQSITRAKYLQEIENGKSEYAAMKAADRYAADVIADRSKGSMPLVFEAKNPIVKAFTMFQIEVKNQWSHLFKDIPATEKNVAKVAFAYTKFAVGAYIFNDVFEKVVGRRSALDPLSWINDAVGDVTGHKLPNFIDAISAALTDDDDDDEAWYEKFLELFDEGELKSRLQTVMPETETVSGGTAAQNVLTNVLQDVPFVGGLLGGGRIPIMSLADPEKLGETAKIGLDVLTKDATLEDVARYAHKNVVVPGVTYGLLPAGGGQIKKGIESTYDILNGGNYLTNSDGEKELRYAVDNTYENWIKGLLFGQYAMDGGREYIDSGFKRLNADKTKLYEALVADGMDNIEAESVIKNMPTKKADLAQYLLDTDLTENQKNMIYDMVNTPEERTVNNYLEKIGYDETAAQSFIDDLPEDKSKWIDSIKKSDLSLKQKNELTEKLEKAQDSKPNFGTQSTLDYSMLSDSQQDYVKALTSAGLKFQEALDGNEKINNADVSQAKAVKFVEAGLSVDEAISAAQEIDRNGLSQDKVLKFMDNGLTYKEAADATRSLANYRVEYIQAAVLMEKDYYTKDLCEALGISDSAIDRASVIHDNGYSVTSVNRRYKEANLDGKNNVTQKEAKEYLDSQNMTRKEKAAWFRILTNAKDKSNPYL